MQFRIAVNNVTSIIAATATVGLIAGCNKLGHEVAREEIQIEGSVNLPNSDVYGKSISNRSSVVVVPVCNSCGVSQAEWEVYLERSRPGAIVIPSTFLDPNYAFFAKMNIPILLDPTHKIAPPLVHSYAPVAVELSDAGAIVKHELIDIQRPPATFR